MLSFSPLLENNIPISIHIDILYFLFLFHMNYVHKYRPDTNLLPLSLFVLSSVIAIRTIIIESSVSLMRSFDVVLLIRFFSYGVTFKRGILCIIHFFVITSGILLASISVCNALRFYTLVIYSEAMWNIETLLLLLDITGVHAKKARSHRNVGLLIYF